MICIVAFGGVGPRSIGARSARNLGAERLDLKNKAAIYNRQVKKGSHVE